MVSTIYPCCLRKGGGVKKIIDIQANGDRAGRPQRGGSMFHRSGLMLCVLILLATAGCSKTENKPAEMATGASEPAPLYAQKDGDVYMYVAASTPEQTARGETPSIFNVRYLGSEGDVYRLEQMDDSGARLAILECVSPCRVVKSSTVGGVTKVAVPQGSLIDVAFRDAFNGLLAQSASPSARSSTRSGAPAEQKISEQSPSVSVPMQPIISGRWLNYRTRIKEGWSTEPTFGGRYVVIRMGCGTGCSFNIVGDHQTGLIYDLGLGGEDMQMLELQFNNRSNQIEAQWADSETDSCVRQTFVWNGVALSPSGGKAATTRPVGGCPSIT